MSMPFAATARACTVLCLLAFCAPAGAVVLRVGSAAACDFSSIGDALGSLADGDHSYQVLVMGETFSDNIVVDGKTFTLDGDYANCSDLSRGGTTTITRDHTGDSILEIRGNSEITLSNITITNGSITSTNGAGGGINFDGHGDVTLQAVTVVGNYAGYGGGINVDANGGAAVLRVNADTLILNNIAQFSGGGIRMHGDSQLYMLQDHTLVYNNTARGLMLDQVTPKDGYGGGIEIVAPAQGYIGSPGYNGEGVITGNTARYGGGISLTGAGGQEDDPTLELFTTDAAHPVRISGNRASEHGGGIQLEPNSGLTTNSKPVLCAFDFRFDGNSAKDGSAIFGDSDAGGAGVIGSRVYLNTHVCGPDPYATFSAATCAGADDCNRIDGNLVQDFDGHPTDGSPIVLLDGETWGANLIADRFALSGNTGTHAMYLGQNDGNRFFNTVTNCLITDNVVTDDLIRTVDDTPLVMTGCTIANNTIGGANVFGLSDDFTLLSTIVWQSGKTTFAHVGGSGSLQANDVLTIETQSLNGAGINIVNRDPRFMDPAHGDYHLQPASGAVDAGYVGVLGTKDRDGAARCIDMTLVSNQYPAVGNAGKCDLGAYERQSIGNIVLNPGFDTDLRLWSEVVPGINQWQAAGGIYTSANSRIFIQPSANGSHAGLTQCVRVPGPGVYRLTGLGTGFSFGITNATRVHWRYLAGTDDTCAAPPDVEGDINFPLAADALLRAPLAQAYINVLPERWGFYSAIQLTTFVDTSNASGSFNTVGSFDDVSLTADGDEIFRNGFD